jgi:predicted transcriptional regulator
MRQKMSRTVTLRLPDKTYQQFRTLAERENRPLSNFIETAALRYIETEQFVDEFEMEEIRGNAALNRSLKRGMKDAKAGRGRFV